MGNAIGNIFDCPELRNIQNYSKEYLSEYFQAEEISSLNYPEVLEEVLMKAEHLKLNYPEILDEILKKVDSAVLSSKSSSILGRVKGCSHSILSKKDLDLKLVAAGSVMTFLLTCAGNNIANTLAQNAANLEQNFMSSTWVSPSNTKQFALSKENMCYKTEGISMSVDPVNTMNIPLADSKNDIAFKNSSISQNAPVTRSKTIAPTSGTEIKAAEAKAPASRVGVADIMHQCKKTIAMTASAYDLSYKSCSKTREHPAYGITASGKRATVGRTIAVDPSVIPLGTRVYISFPDAFNYLDGIYIAEDTGSLIKGNKIDVFFGEDQPGESLIYNKAMGFGLQEVVVYLLD